MQQLSSWGDARAWLGGEHFDGVVNYHIAWSTLGWVADGRLQEGHARESIPYGCISGERYREVLLETLSWCRPEVNQAQLNLLDSHDVPRALHMLQGDVAALKLAGAGVAVLSAWKLFPGGIQSRGWRICAGSSLPWQLSGRTSQLCEGQI